MIGMDWLQWLIVAGCATAVFVVVEAEKSLRNYLSNIKVNTDDQ
jgi:hypothetical protein